MRPLSVLLICLFSVIYSSGQDIKTVSTFFDQGKLDKAKITIDALMAADAKKAENLYWKHKVYYAISQSNTYKAQTPDALATGFAALKEYYKADKNTEVMIKDGQLQMSKPAEIYYDNFRKEGGAQIDAGKYEAAFQSLRNALSVSHFYYEMKWINSDVDTSILFYTGYAAMQAKKKQDAVYYFTKLTDANAAGTDIHIAYGWLCNYLLEDKKDLAAARIVCNKGLGFYPGDEYLKSKKVQIEQQSGNTENLFNSYEEIIKSGHAGFSDYLAYGAELYDYLYANNGRPVSDADKKEARMIEVMNKALSMKSSSAETHYILGLYYTNKAIAVNKGNGSAQEQTDKKKTVAEYSDKSVEHLEAAVKNFGAKSSLTANNRENYKSALQQLINLYKFKKMDDKVKQAEEKLKTL